MYIYLKIVSLSTDHDRTERTRQKNNYIIVKVSFHFRRHKYEHECRGILAMTLRIQKGYTKAETHQYTTQNNRTIWSIQQEYHFSTENKSVRILRLRTDAYGDHKSHGEILQYWIFSTFDGLFSTTNRR